MVAEEYKSFVVRIWRNQPHHEQADRWHGEIEHIQSGTRWDFSTLNELLAFLQQAVTTEVNRQWDPEKGAT